MEQVIDVAKIAILQCIFLRFPELKVDILQGMVIDLERPEPEFIFGVPAALWRTAFPMNGKGCRE